MKKKLVLALATLMCISLCACGGSESTNGDNKDGFTPSKPTETTETENKEETVDTSNMTVEEMQKYYDVEKYVGTPRIETLQAYVMGENVSLENDNFYTTVKNESNNLKDWKWYECIICDNNTPDDTSDDVLAYIFTTPVEK